jgi:hypothetical protein
MTCYVVLHLYSWNRTKMLWCSGLLLNGVLLCWMFQVLLSICSLLTDPNPDDPLVPEIVQDGPAEIWVNSSQLDAEICDGLTNTSCPSPDGSRVVSRNRCWAPLFPWICFWSCVSLIHLGSYCSRRRPTIIAIHSEVVGHALPMHLCLLGDLPLGRCYLVNVHRRHWFRCLWLFACPCESFWM